MARARNIRPGFFKNEDLAECSPWARLCFAGLWCLADRDGRLEDRPKRIKGELFPFDTVDVEPLLQELERWKFIVRYEAAGLHAIQILNFAKHQSPHYSEKDSEIEPPSLPGFERIKGDEFREDSRKEGAMKRPPTPDDSRKKGVMKRGSQPPDSLIPDSLITPSSLRSEGEGADAPLTPAAKTSKSKREDCTLAAFLATCREQGVKPVPEDHPIRRWAADAGVTDEMLQIAWVAFRERYTDDAQYRSKRYRDWAGHFANSVKDSWFGLWFQAEEGGAPQWTSKGLLRKQALDARQAQQQQRQQEVCDAPA